MDEYYITDGGKILTDPEDRYVRDEHGKPVAIKPGMSLLSAMLRAKPGSKLWDGMMRKQSDQRVISEEEHRKMMADPFWHR